MNNDINISNDRDLMDDTEGHGRRMPRPEVNDTDGHGRRLPAPSTTVEDTDGHGRRAAPAPS